MVTKSLSKVTSRKPEWRKKNKKQKLQMKEMKEKSLTIWTLKIFSMTA